MRVAVNRPGSEAGTWISSQWGRYAPFRLVQMAHWHGFKFSREDCAAFDRVKAELEGGPAAPEADWGALDALADSAEEWVNENVAPAGFRFGWDEGEFVLMTIDWWEAFE